MRVSLVVLSVTLAACVMASGALAQACAEGTFRPNDAATGDCTCVIASKVDETDNPLVLDLTNTNFIGDWLHIYYTESVKYTGTTPQHHSTECGAAFVWEPVTYTNNGCTRVHHGRVPWSVAYNKDNAAISCGVTRQAGQNGATASPTHITFTYDFVVQNQELLPAIRGTQRTRTLIQRMPFQIVFPIEVTATSGPVDVFAPVLLVAAVTKQEVFGDTPSASPKSATFEVLTSLQWPFELLAPVLTAPAAKSAGTATISNILPSTQCEQQLTGSGICLQKWQFTISALTTTVCDFDGNYNLAFTVGCRDGRDGNCPIDGNTDDAALAFTIDTANHCAVVADNIGLTADLVTYQDSAVSIPKRNFLDTQVVWAGSHVVSTEASLLGTTFSDVKIVKTVGASTTEYPLLETNVESTHVAPLKFKKYTGAAVGPNVASVPRFEFTVDSTYLSVPQDGIVTVTLVATVQLQYSSAGKNPLVKPDILAVGEEGDQVVTVLANYGVQQNAVLARFDLSGASSGASSSSASSKQVFGLSQLQAGGIIIGGVAFLAIAVVAAVAVRYRRRERMIADAIASRSSTSDVSLVVV